MTQAKPNNKETVIAALLDAGFVSDGQTAYAVSRIATTESPIYGGIGGQPITMGGRQRFTLPNTNIKATVGKVTTYFYRLHESKPMEPIAHLPTKNIDAIHQTILELKVNA